MTHNQNNGLKRFLLLYASQTGQAKAIAEEIAEAAPFYGLRADLRCMSLVDKRFILENETCAVFVVSTTGEGRPPDTAKKFKKRFGDLTKRNCLEKLHYTILALGDTNYARFCKFGRDLNQWLLKVSAKPFYEQGLADDSIGIENVSLSWILGLWPALQKQLQVECLSESYANSISMNGTHSYPKTAQTEPAMNREQECNSISDLPAYLEAVDMTKCRVLKLLGPTLKLVYTEDPAVRVDYHHPHESMLHSKASHVSLVKLISSKQLTSGDDVKNTLELKLQFLDSPIPYKPGDSYGFICPNPHDEVELLLKRLNVFHLSEKCASFSIANECVSKQKLPSHLPPLTTLRDVCLHCIEIRSVPKKILLRTLAEYTTDEVEKNSLLYLSSPEGSKVYTNCVRKPSLSVTDILLHFKSCCPPIERIIEYLPFLKPRFYSVASSPLKESGSFNIVFNVLKFIQAEGRMTSREGVCTGWLHRMGSGLKSRDGGLADQLSELSIHCDKLIRVYKRTNLSFHLPENVECPIVMVGPGTGIAPFIGFLQQRETQMEMYKDEKKFGSTWLFYGCRYKDKDFLYKTELQRLQSVGALTRLVLSLSRESVLPPGIETKYVHESIKNNADALTQIVNVGGRIFVCGDAKNMARDVQQAFIDSFQKSLDMSQNDAKTFVQKLQSDNRYINDVWA